MARSTAGTPRKSNLELMRILLMYLIVAHHMVVNSGVSLLWVGAALTPSEAFLTLWAMWGKSAINAFVMVTGWFMYRSRFTWRRYAKLLLQIYFWIFAGWVLLALVGAQGVTMRAIAKSIVSPFRDINDDFVASFLAMYLFIPFMNRLIDALDRSSFLRLLGVLLVVYSLIPTFLDSNTAFTEFGWYCTLYLLAAFLRIHKPAWSNDRHRVSLLFAGSVTLSIVSVCVLMILGRRMGLDSWIAYYLVFDSGKLLALACGVSCFLWFQGLEMRRNRIVNAIASITFGVLLIHAHSDVMRVWLWEDTIDVVGHYLTLSLPALAAWSIAVPAAVFCVCGCLDMLRQRFVEPLYMNWLDKKAPAIEKNAQRIEAWVRGHIG